MPDSRRSAAPWCVFSPIPARTSREPLDPCFGPTSKNFILEQWFYGVNGVGLEPGVALGTITLIAASVSAIYGLVGATESISDDKSAKAALVRVAIESLGRQGVTGICSAYQDGKQSGEVTVKSDYCTKDVARYTALASDEQTVSLADKWFAEVSPDAAKISWSRKPTFTERLITGIAPTVWSVGLGQAVKVGQDTIDVKVRTGDVRRYNFTSKPEIAVGSQVAVEIADSKSASNRLRQKFGNFRANASIKFRPDLWRWSKSWEALAARLELNSPKCPQSTGVAGTQREKEF
jgi:hypothetical protein